jgi:hyperosmotically inducible periplasmic protein
MQKHNQTSKWLVVSAFALSLGAALPAFAEGAGQYIDDATITTKVKAALMGDSQLKATQVSVETDQGVVKLSGAVDSKGQESQAVNDASKISGVKSVQDLLSVKGAAQEQQEQ